MPTRDPHPVFPIICQTQRYRERASAKAERDKEKGTEERIRGQHQLPLNRANSHEIEFRHGGGLIAGALGLPAAGAFRPRQSLAERLKHVAQCDGHQCHIVGGYIARGHHLAVSDA